MAVPANGPIFCDPGPCDPWKLDLFARGYEWWILLLVIVTALLAGLAARRSNWKLSLASMSMIAVLIYLQVASTLKLQRLHFIHLAGPRGDLTSQDRRGLDELWFHEVQLAAIGYVGFSLAPFLIGLAVSVVRDRRSSAAQGLIGNIA